ncbi:xanthine dehydrogenase family protein molybdopterin-binding subunit, partial [Sphingomonas sp. DT-51]|uniref:xanthine dehydrogenase family protein molybdopterin-binding subunit n=1 Tax=Sphingomonas sp. DT-51 TaxID=3396165 RepID=UPI003F1A973A
MSRVQNVVVDSVRTALGWVPAQWLPGGTPDPLIGAHGELGRQAPRVDAELKVRGDARFSAEVAMPGLCYAALVHATVTRGRIVRIDTAAATAAPGVLLVVDHRNMPRVRTPGLISMTDPTATGNSSLPILQDDCVHYNGQIVAAVVAETQEQADHAATLIAIDYEKVKAETRFDAAKADARIIPSLLIERNHLSLGRAERELARSAHRVDERYRTQWQNHNAIELHALTVAWEGERLTVHDTIQMVAAEAASLAKTFGLKREQVRVLSPFVGGGFGGKGVWDHQIVAVAAARLVGRPLRLQLSRESVYRIIGGRSATEQRVAIGADADGCFTAILHDGWSVMPPYGACPEAYTLGTRAAYRARSFEILQRHVDLAVVPNTFMRAPGEAIGTFALESAVDELAHAIGLDPVELRLRNLPDRHPVSGAPFSQHAPEQSWRRGATRFGWAARAAAPGTRREGEWRIGMGCGGGSFPYVRMPGGAVRLTLRRDGTAHLACSAQEMGMGTATVMAQQLADRLGLPLASVSVEIGDSDLPAAPMAGGSAQTVSLAGAILAAAEKLLPDLLRLAGNDSPLAGLRAGEVQWTEGGLAGVRERERHETFRSV